MEMIIAVYGANSLQVASNQEHLSRGYQQLGDFKKALASFRSAFSIYKSVLGEEHEKTKTSLVTMKTLTEKAVEAARLQLKQSANIQVR